jgi:ribosomal protein S18 acetylase RimI-like enzyme
MIKEQVRAATAKDLPAIAELYRAVARQKGGIARTEQEITAAYVELFVNAALTHGIILVAEDPRGQIVGDIHATTPQIAAFSHVLGDPTIVVHPDAQGRGIGTLLLSTVLKEIEERLTHIERFELFVRESNTRAIALYEKLGFCKEGLLARRIRAADGSYESDVIMAWLRPDGR